jgi:hypothetical protein
MLLRFDHRHPLIHSQLEQLMDEHPTWESAENINGEDGTCIQEILVPIRRLEPTYQVLDPANQPLESCLTNW